MAMQNKHLFGPSLIHHYLALTMHYHINLLVSNWLGKDNETHFIGK